MSSASGLRSTWPHALAALALLKLAGACTYDFDQFESLSAPVGDGGPDAAGGAKADAAPDNSGARAGSGGGSAGKGGSSGTAGSGGATGGVGGATAGAGGATGGTGGKGGTAGGATGGTAGQGGSGGASGTGGGAGTGGTGGASGSGGSGATGGTGGSDGGAPDASLDGQGGGGTGGTIDAGGAGGSTGGSGGSAGTAGTGGTAITDASDVTPPPADAEPDRGVTDAAPDAGFDCAAVGGTTYQGHCYYARTVAVDWNTASTSTCEAPAHLVTITSAGEQNVVTSLLSNQDRWIGLRRPLNSPKNESSFYWVTNETISYRNWEIYSDADREPNYTGECVRMRFTGMWADVACTEALAVVCEHD